MAVYNKQVASRELTTQTIAFTQTSASAASKIGAESFQLRLTADAACCYALGDGAQVATSASPFLPALVDRYVICTPGQQIAAIRAPTDGTITATSGTLYITEMS